MLSGLAFRFGFCGWVSVGWMDALLVGGVFGGVFCFRGISPWIVVFIVGYLVFSAGLFRRCYWWDSWAFRFRVG